MTTTDSPWIGSTQQLIDGWRVVLHWHEIDGNVIPAGLEVRRYGVQEDHELTEQPTDATPEATHYDGVSYSPDRAPASLTSTLLTQTRWGDVFAAQRGRLVASLEDYADDTPADRTWAAERGERAGRGMVLLDDAEAPVRAATGVRGDPPNDATFRLVANLLGEVGTKHPLRVLHALRDDHDFPFSDPPKDSERVKVRAWCVEARRRHSDEFEPPPGRKQRTP